MLKMKRCKRQWLFLILLAGFLVILYNTLASLSAFFSDGYARYKIQELELQNDLLLMQLGLSRDKIYTLMKNTSLNQAELLDDEITCDIVRHIPKCETIHVAMVCAGYKSSKIVVTLLKSLLFYRKNPMHFHIMVDDVANKILDELFKTWDIPQVYVSFYSTRDAEPSVNWVPNSHYSGVYGLLKLTLPKILPRKVRKIIVLDTDVTFVANIAELWALFTKFRDKQAIGLVENQSNWYLGKLRKHYKPWPAIGRGFNTGVILMNLKVLNELDWPNLWVTATENTLNTQTSTALADQDIFNTVIKQNPYLIYPISCQWNVQLGDHTLSDKCYENYEVKVIHWNSPRKHEVSNKDIDYFLSIYYTFVEYNGNLLRSNFNGCHNKPTKLEAEEICSDFKKFERYKWRTHIYIREFIYEPSLDSVDVTLVLHITMGNLRDFEELCNYWEGPISVAIHATDSECDYLLEYIEHSEILKDRFNIGYHVVYKEMRVYPLNTLRNVGLKNVVTDYVFLTDIEYLPAFDLYSNLKNAVILMENNINKKVLVVSAFEKCTKYNTFPSNKTELLRKIDRKECTYIPDSKNAFANFTKWRTAIDPYKIQILSNISNILVEKTIPVFDPRFLDESWSRTSHFLELQGREFEFQKLPDVFVVRKNILTFQIPSYWRSEHYSMCLNLQKAEFSKNLTRRFGYVYENEVF